MQKRAEIAAKLAAMKNSNLSGPATQKTPGIAAPIPTKPIPAKAVIPSPASSSTPSSTPKPTPGLTPPSGSGSGTPAGVGDDLARRVAEAKKRVAEAQTKLAIKDNPYMVRSSQIYLVALSHTQMSIVGYGSNGEEERLNPCCRTSTLSRCRSQNGCSSSTPRTYDPSYSIQERPIQTHAT